MMGWATWLKPNNSVPVGDIHVNALEFAWEKHAVVGNKIAGLLQFVHPLFEPMLGRHQRFKVFPVFKDDRGQLAKIDKA